ncbi:MAG TPA: 6-hydroxymethylpterin diphosphokinase MptE-like protein [Leptolinea sp.]
MTSFRETIKQGLPQPALSFLRDTRDSIQRWQQWPASVFDPRRRATLSNLTGLKDSHKGERCFIIGNGPSLKLMDLSRLKNENTIGMNRFYLMFPELGFKTTYFVSVNDLVVEQCASDLQSLDIPTFISWRGRHWVQPRKDLFYLFTTYTGPKFAKDIRGRLWEGATVTYISMQVAFYLGFQQVVLIGVDHNFATKGKPNTTVISQGDDPNHFSGNYFGKGFRWQLPDLDTSEQGYIRAREVYRDAGREILDATVGGKLTVYPKVDFESLF